MSFDQKSLAQAHTREQSIEWLIRLQSPVLTKQDERDFFKWLYESPEHQRAYKNTEKLWASLGRSNQVSIDNLTILRSESPRKQTSLWTGIALAASLMFAAVLIGINYTAVETHQYVTAVGQQKRLQLEDGSRVILNTNSQLKFSESSDSRLATLVRGEALFEVTHNPNKPFIIDTANGLVRVLGTRFSVRAEPRSTTVTVLEGKVGLTNTLNISEASALNPELEATLVADQQLTLNEASRGLAPRLVNAQALTAWQEGKLVYENTPLPEIVKDLSRYFDGRIELADPSLYHIQVVAVLELKSKRTTLNALKTAFSLRSEETPEGVTLLYPQG